MASLSDGSYARKMEQLARNGTDFEVDVRFVDMLIPRNSKALDLGCGIGSAVKGLRDRGHQAFGIDVEQSVLTVAQELYGDQWFRLLDASQLTPDTLNSMGMPSSYDLVLMDGNVPSFLSPKELRITMRQIADVLVRDGVLVTGTTSHSVGGPSAQDQAATSAGLVLTHRFSDWHLAPFAGDSPWCVSVYAATHNRRIVESPGGVFILPPQREP